ncbi:MAG: hypothetical protein LC640_08925 [Frankia sp.]|nr:hypothetical protein [Frankia sp.]
MEPGTTRTAEEWSEADFRARAAIRGRLKELRAIHASYLAYQEHRVNERDHHGAWDVAINLAETEAEAAGLQFALKAMDVT